MVIDTLQHTGKYEQLHPKLAAAFAYLRTTDFTAVPDGKYPIDGDDIFAIVQSYTTLDAANEAMESHRKYIDVQYMVAGEELVGLALAGGQAVSKPYDDATDYMLYAAQPSFYALFPQGTFMIFYPSDLHMPCIKVAESAPVKKVVVKIKL